MTMHYETINGPYKTELIKPGKAPAVHHAEPATARCSTGSTIAASTSTAATSSAGRTSRLPTTPMPETSWLSLRSESSGLTGVVSFRSAKAYRGALLGSGKKADFFASFFCILGAVDRTPCRGLGTRYRAPHRQQIGQPQRRLTQRARQLKRCQLIRSALQRAKCRVEGSLRAANRGRLRGRIVEVRCGRSRNLNSREFKGLAFSSRECQRAP